MPSHSQTPLWQSRNRLLEVEVGWQVEAVVVAVGGGSSSNSSTGGKRADPSDVTRAKSQHLGRVTRHMSHEPTFHKCSKRLGRPSERAARAPRCQYRPILFYIDGFGLKGKRQYFISPVIRFVGFGTIPGTGRVNVYED